MTFVMFHHTNMYLGVELQQLILPAKFIPLFMKCSHSLCGFVWFCSLCVNAVDGLWWTVVNKPIFVKVASLAQRPLQACNWSNNCELTISIINDVWQRNLIKRVNVNYSKYAPCILWWVISSASFLIFLNILFSSQTHRVSKCKKRSVILFLL